MNKGYSFSSKQYYSASQNKVRLDLHSNKTDHIIISVSSQTGWGFDACCCLPHLHRHYLACNYISFCTCCNTVTSTCCDVVTYACCETRPGNLQL